MSLHFFVLVLISSPYFVPVGSAAHFSDAPPVIISDGGVPVNPPAESRFKSPEIPAAAAAYPSAGEAGGTATLPEVNASRTNRELIEANASVSLPVTINKAGSTSSNAAASATTAAASAASFPEVNASRPYPRKLIAATDSNSTESPGY